MEPFIGQIQLFAYSFAPKGWMTCSGQTISISQNTALFSLLGTTFGGDGKTTFALPTMQPPGPGLQYCIAINGVYPSRD